MFSFCGAGDRKEVAATGLIAVAGPTEPTRFIWRGIGHEADGRVVEWVRIKLSPSSRAGMRYVQGICAKVAGQPRPYCSGGLCDERRCDLGGGRSYTYGFRARTAADPNKKMDIRWSHRLRLERPGPRTVRIELPSYGFKGGLRLQIED